MNALLALILVSAPAAPTGENSLAPLYAPVPTVVPARIQPAAPVSAVARRHDGSPWYLRVNGGLVTTEESSQGSEEIDFDEGFLLALAVGQRVTSGEHAVNFNMEIEGLFTDQDADDDGVLQAVNDVTVMAAFLNGMLTVDLAERFAFYGGAGIGPGWLDIGTESGFDDEDGPFLAWQARAGFAWRFAESTALELGYRFVNIDDAEVDDGGVGNTSFDLETQQHGLEVGLCFGL